MINSIQLNILHMESDLCLYPSTTLPILSKEKPELKVLEKAPEAQLSMN